MGYLFILRQGLSVWLRLASNFQPSTLSLLSAGITDGWYPSELTFIFFKRLKLIGEVTWQTWMSAGAKTPLLMAPGMLSSKCTVDSGTGESRAWEVSLKEWAWKKNLMEHHLEGLRSIWPSVRRGER